MPSHSIEEIIELTEQAHEAGMIAANEAESKLSPINITESDIFNNPKPDGKSYVIPDLCGFAWINIKPANSKLAKYIREFLGGRKDHYYGGISLSVRHFNQSITLKEAYARAFAKVLKDAGYEKVYAHSRLD